MFLLENHVQEVATQSKSREREKDVHRTRTTSKAGEKGRAERLEDQESSLGLILVVGLIRNQA
jgi:hypothetical protein